MTSAPGWPALIVAKVLAWLRGRLLDLADRSKRRPRLGLAAIWLSDRCGRVGLRLLTIRFESKPP